VIVVKRLGRIVLGTIGGLLWGAGTAVLVQQYGLWPLDPALAYGAPLAASAISGLWSRSRSKSVARTQTAAALAMIPVLVLAFQQPGCDVTLSTESNFGTLAATSPSSPFTVDPATDSRIIVEVAAGDGDGRVGEVWIEFGGIPVFTDSDVVSGSMQGEFDLTDNGYVDLSGAPGIYHIGGSIKGLCTADGYVRIAGNPLTAPVGQAAAGAVVLGLLLTWAGGRPPKDVHAVVTSKSGRLLPSGDQLAIGKGLIRSPGLSGDAVIHAASESTIRRVAGWTEETREALARHHVAPDQIVELNHTIELPDTATRSITTHHGEPALELELPAPGAGNGQLILASDESGVITWHLPRLADNSVDIRRLGASCRYRIPRRVAAGDDSPPRNLVRAFGSKVLTSMVFPLLDPVFGAVGERFARVWETRRRPYRFRSFTPDDYDLETAAEPDWDHIAGGKALLFVHGTFSQAHTGFGALPPTTIEDLHELYDGRVFAFDHFTLSADPRQNVVWFLANLPSGISLDLDIICHSRGGLVSRVLAERAGEIGTGSYPVNISKVVFTASPNAGTILAEPAYIGDLVDSYTNLLNFVPGHDATDILEGVLTALKQIAVGAVAGLPGLQAMRPGGEFLQWLNAPANNQTRYYAIAGDYEPSVRGWRNYATNRLMDRVFREANDLVVPTEGTYGANGSSRFPIEERLLFSEYDGISHTDYFGNKTLRERVLDWLGSD
jgi:hypothetical protein